jgi:hypothetical protein
MSDCKNDSIYIQDLSRMPIVVLHRYRRSRDPVDRVMSTREYVMQTPNAFLCTNNKHTYVYAMPDRSVMDILRVLLLVQLLKLFYLNVIRTFDQNM